MNSIELQRQTLLFRRMENCLKARDAARNPEFKTYWQGVYDTLKKQLSLH